MKTFRVTSHAVVAVLMVLIGSAAALCGCGGMMKEPAPRPTEPDLPPLVGKSRSKPGHGVDLCLHSEAVRRNSLSNPNLAWDNESSFTIMGHGRNDSMLGPVLLDERADPALHIPPVQLVSLIENDDGLRRTLSSSQYVLIYSCRMGAVTPQGMPSFAARLANQVNKPVIAPTNRLLMSQGSSLVDGNGTFEVFYPP